MPLVFKLNKRNKWFVLIIIFALTITIFPSNKSALSAEFETAPTRPINVISADPIYITSDTELEAAGFPGIGTSNDPYRIEYLDINTTDSEGIYISGVTLYFLIRNCTISAQNYGIKIDTVTAGRAEIWNCTISNSDVGIQILYTNNAETFNNTVTDCTGEGIWYYHCDSSFIYYNTISNCWRGIYVSSSYHPFVYYNEVYDCREEGIITEGTDEIVIQYNICDRNDIGIEVYSSYDPFVGNNWCSDNEHFGVYIRYSNFARVGGNNFHACGLGVYDSVVEDLLTLRVTSNYIDGSLIYYGENITDTNIWVRYSQFILVNCSNVQISSQDQLKTSLSRPINLLFCQDIDIRFCFINYAEYGIAIQYSDDIKIYNNTLEHNDLDIVSAITTGGFIRENLFYDGIIAIHFMEQSHNFSIYENNFQSFSAYGIALENSNYNEIFHNNFISCGVSSYGYDSGTGNYWYNTTLLEGNYWSNWVSGPYSITGPSGSSDLYPLSSPYIQPVISEYIIISWFSVIFLFIMPMMTIYLKKRK